MQDFTVLLEELMRQHRPPWTCDKKLGVDLDVRVAEELQNLYQHELRICNELVALVSDHAVDETEQCHFARQAAHKETEKLAELLEISLTCQVWVEFPWRRRDARLRLLLQQLRDKCLYQCSTARK